MDDLRTDDFDYELPEELIAQTPLKNRASSRLLVVDRKKDLMEDKVFHEIKTYLQPGDCLVINDTKVMPARLFGKRKDTGAVIEILLLKRMTDRRFECLVKPGKKAKAGTGLIFSNEVSGTILSVLENGNRLIELEFEGILEEVLDRIGTMPLPPYITERLTDKNRYQTVYANHPGSAAAPTAGLHFTEDLLAEIEAMGVEIARVELKVGLGTFRPVKEEYIKDHFMHKEEYGISKEAAELINRTKAVGKRVIAVGTTSLRSLESNADENGEVREFHGDTEIFIYPGYRFKVVDALITNFHLPKSTLMMLVSALAGKERIEKAYRHAIENRYRFFSFGDAMLIL